MTESSFRLTDTERASVQRDLDIDALERLLSMLPADARQSVLRLAYDWSKFDLAATRAAFPEIAGELGAGQPEFVIPQLRNLGTNDPVMRAAIDAVLAPRRERGPKPR